MIKRKPARRERVGDVIGEHYSSKEKEWNQKYNIWTPENDKMVVSSEGPLTWTQFSSRLKKINKNIFIHFNPNTPSPEAPFGHAIRIKTNEFKEGYDPICGVGKGGEKIIPAMSTYNHFWNEDKKQYETRLDAQGWVVAEEKVINYLISKGISNGS